VNLPVNPSNVSLCFLLLFFVNLSVDGRGRSCNCNGNASLLALSLPLSFSVIVCDKEEKKTHLKMKDRSMDWLHNTPREELLHLYVDAHSLQGGIQRLCQECGMFVS